MKVEYYEKYDNETFNMYKVMQFPLSHELIQDCYMLNQFDAPSEFKLLFLEEVAKAFDELIIKESPNYVDKYLLMDKLSKIEIKYKSDAK